MPPTAGCAGRRGGYPGAAHSSAAGADRMALRLSQLPLSCPPNHPYRTATPHRTAPRCHLSQRHRTARPTPPSAHRPTSPILIEVPPKRLLQKRPTAHRPPTPHRTARAHHYTHHSHTARPLPAIIGAGGWRVGSDCVRVQLYPHLAFKNNKGAGQGSAGAPSPTLLTGRFEDFIDRWLSGRAGFDDDGRHGCSRIETKRHRDREARQKHSTS